MLRVSTSLKGSQEMAVLPKELIFMTAVCDSVKEVAVWAKHANSKEVCLPRKDSSPQGLCSQFCPLRAAKLPPSV